MRKLAVNNGLYLLSNWIFAGRYRPWLILALIFSAGFLQRLWQYGWIVNDDGTLYLYAAKEYLASGHRAALEIYEWPYYSILIAQISRCFNSDLAVSAWAVNYLFQGFQVGFIALIAQRLGVTRTNLFWLLLLFVISTVFHNFRVYIMRDQGFLAFALAGAYFAVKFLEQHRGRDYLAFMVSFLISVVFRVEGAILLLFGVVGLSYLTGRYRYALFVLVLLLLLGVMDVLAFNGTITGPLFSQVKQKIHGIAEQLSTTKQLLEQYVFLKYWSDYSAVALLSMYIGTYIAYMLSGVTWYGLGLFYGYKSPVEPAGKILLWFAAAVLAYCFVMLLARGFLVYRYNLLLVYLLVVYALYKLLIAARQRRRFARFFLVLVVLASLEDFLSPPDGGKRFLIQAQAVIETLGLSNQRIYSNARQISLMNNVAFGKASKYSKKMHLLEEKVARPLADDEAVIMYRRIDQGFAIHPANCQVFSRAEESKQVVVVAAVNPLCLKSGEPPSRAGGRNVSK